MNLIVRTPQKAYREHHNTGKFIGLSGGQAIGRAKVKKTTYFPYYVLAGANESIAGAAGLHPVLLYDGFAGDILYTAEALL